MALGQLANRCEESWRDASRFGPEENSQKEFIACEPMAAVKNQPVKNTAPTSDNVRYVRLMSKKQLFSWAISATRTNPTFSGSL